MRTSGQEKFLKGITASFLSNKADRIRQAQREEEVKPIIADRLKREISAKLADDVQAFLAAGGTITQLPAFASHYDEGELAAARRKRGYRPAY